MSSSSSIKGNNYYQLLEAFNETHEEANRLALSHNRLKGLNNLLENRIKSLEEELGKTKKKILKTLIWFTKTHLVVVSQKLVKILKILKERFIIF